MTDFANGALCAKISRPHARTRRDPSHRLPPLPKRPEVFDPSHLLPRLTPGVPLLLGRKLEWLLGAVAVAAITVPGVIVAYAPRVLPRPAADVQIHRIVPRAELPNVEPMKFVNLPPRDARAFNATVPFSTMRNPAARPFRLAGSIEDRARAIDCMAAAVLFEAGDDTLGQRAVAQVVINRARHPAFPKTICGVVFQGSERRTGCQFTFTCDGALETRRWSGAARDRAYRTARAALTGAVYRPVGYATHYHTDWVVPYWSSSLDKVAEVNTHLFFRWTGWWGTPPAFNRRVASAEPAITKLSSWSGAHEMGAAIDKAAAAPLDATAADGALPQPIAGNADSFFVTLDSTLPPDSFAALASKTCGDRVYCKFMGWSDKAKTPGTLPLEPGQIATLSFSYLRDRALGYDKPLWNCAEFRRPPAQCMKVQMLAPATRLTALPKSALSGDLRATSAGAPMPPKPAIDGLAGVRRRVELRAIPVGAASAPR